MPNCSEKIQIISMDCRSQRNICQIVQKNYKLFLWIVDLREIYTKLFTNVRDRTYQNADANGCNGSEAQRTNADNI